MFIWFLPYLLIFTLLNIPEALQEKLSLSCQEWSLRGGLFFRASHEDRKQGALAIERAQPLVVPAPASSPWIEARLFSHKQFPWSHIAWIDRGSKAKDLPFPIAVGCPVVYGQYLVGIVEKVGSEASQIRLLSDPLLRPAVRVQRMARNIRKENAAYLLLHELEAHPELIPKETHRAAFIKLLTSLTTSFAKGQKLSLAKGELQGSFDIQKPTILRGIGFNYDVEDEEGPARDIRTGQDHRDSSKMALIQPGDVLVTSGLDGFFPKGLLAAYVKQVNPLEEGGISYEISAEVACPCFLDLSTVALLPPLPKEAQEEPSDLTALMKQIEAEIGSLES